MTINFGCLCLISGISLETMSTALESTWKTPRFHLQCQVDFSREKMFKVKDIACSLQLILIIIHQTHHEKSDWSRAFNQFTIACELDMIKLISAADITFIMSSSTSAWLLSPLECSPQKQNG